MSVGRPSDYTTKLAQEICNRLADGEPLAEICRDEGMPHPSTVRRWAKSNEALSLAIADAREDGEDRIAADCLAIADDARNDWMEKYDKDGDSIGWQLNGDHVQRSKLRIDTRLKLLAKWNPKKYGDKVQVENSGKIVVADETDEEIAARFAAKRNGG